MTRRAGTTLVEVLVAIFIMAIGLMTLLTLFPLGALSMAQAIKDTRTGHAAANAAALAEAMKVRQDVLVQQALDNQRTVTIGGLQVTQTLILPTPPADSPSYPVYVDPLGRNAAGAPPVPPDDWPPPAMGTAPANPIRRIIPKMLVPPLPTGSGNPYRWFSLLDDMNFDKDGPTAGLPAGAPATIEREGRYSWAYLLKRPRMSDKSLVELTIVLYSGRPSQAPLGEQLFSGVKFDTNSNAVQVPYSGAKPDIRKGNWILDATIFRPAGLLNTPEPHGFFYRVVGVTDQGTSLLLELENRPKMPTIDSGGNGYGKLIFMENVVEVFEKGTGWQP